MQDVEMQTEINPKLRVDALIARGSFGKVFRGRQVSVGRDVAIKILRAELGAETEAGPLFRDEIRAIGTIDHPNVVRIFDADQSRDGRLYFVMELLAGPTLQQIADAGRVSPARARFLVAQLLDGLAAVHDAGHIHADVKPSNAIVTGSGDNERVVLIDFGLSRMQIGDMPAEAVGGTRAYMAPEQLRAWELAASSDVFSAALILVKLLTGWHRTEDLGGPPLGLIIDAQLRSIVTAALVDAPSLRPSAATLARALRGGTLDQSGAIHRPAFSELEPLTELDGEDFHGRAADVARLARRAETSRTTVLTAPSGMGKTSLLRAGLIPRLKAQRLLHAYVACDSHTSETIAEILAPGAASLAEAIARRKTDSPKPLVLVLDQVEVVLASERSDVPMLASVVENAEACDLSVVLGVREDYVARLISVSRVLADGVPQLRLGALDREGARASLTQPLTRHALAFDAALIDRVLDDLAWAAKHLTLGDGAIYPPHLQLVGAALVEICDGTAASVSVDDYERVGGIDAIISGHLDRTLKDFVDADRDVARDILLQLVTSTHTRVECSEVELIGGLGARYGEISVQRVLERLARRRLLAKTSGLDGHTSWSLVHDTLSPRIEAWLTVRDLDRRRIAEVIRFQVRQSTGNVPALLTRAQLRELERFPALEVLLDAENTGRPHRLWTPKSLVQRSREVVRYRRGFMAAALLAVGTLTALLIAGWRHESRLRQQDKLLADFNIGRIDLIIEPFDLQWSAKGVVTRVTVPLETLSSLQWALYEPDTIDREAPGQPIGEGQWTRGEPTPTGEDGIEVRGGDAFLIVDGRGKPGDDCGPSVIPLRSLPGNAHYSTPRRLRVLVPTCQATRFDMIKIPAGEFIAGGAGTPSSHSPLDELPKRHQQDLPEFSIDRTETTNAAFAIFAELFELHQIPAPVYPDALSRLRGPNYPCGGLNWFDARAYCRFMGKDLPLSVEWQKALRGAATSDLAERNYPWGHSDAPLETLAQIATRDVPGNPTFGRVDDPRHPVPVGSVALDRSPYGVMDLAGNLQEWTQDEEPTTSYVPFSRRLRITRGGNWWDTTPDMLVDFMALENPRVPTKIEFYLGARCSSKHP